MSRFSCSALVFGVLRWKSGSTSLTILLHAIVNLSSLLQTVYFVEKAGIERRASANGRDRPVAPQIGPLL